MATKILIFSIAAIAALIFGAAGAWAGLVITATNDTIRDNLAMAILCPRAERYERKDFSGGTIGYGSSAKGSKVFEYTCFYEDGSKEIIENDRAMLTAFAGGAGAGAIIGALAALILSVAVFIIIGKLNKRNSAVI